MKRLYQTSKVKPKFEEIAHIGWSFDIEFHLPPFEGDTTECFFDIHEFKETPQFQDFIKIIERLDIPYKYAKGKDTKRIYMVINGEHLHGV
jgi:hypothetical protein